jgi:hypothetical protein
MGRMRFAKLVWAGPASLLGLVLAPFFARRSLRGGVLLCEGARWPRHLGFKHRAMTLGHVVLCIDDMDDGTFAHELIHVRQYEALGPLFPVAYGVASLWARARGRHHYRDNPSEIQARRESGHG